MKEKFREWIPKGTIKVKWKDKQTGEIGYWIQDVKELFSWVDTIVNQFQGYKIRLTNRQLYYQLVGKDWIPNKMEVYKRICTFITDCRYGGLIDWEAIEDKGRTPTMHIEFEDIKERIEVALYNFRLKRWSNQHYYVELYCENVRKNLNKKWNEYRFFNRCGELNEEYVYQIKGLRKNYQTLEFAQQLDKWKNPEIALQFTSKKMRHSSTRITAYHYIENFDTLNISRWANKTKEEILNMGKQNLILQYI